MYRHWFGSQKKHKREIEKYNGNMKELVNDISNLRYDSLAEFFVLLGDKLALDSIADFKRNRPKLAKNLGYASVSIQDAGKHIKDAWNICESIDPDCESLKENGKAK